MALKLEGRSVFKLEKEAIVSLQKEGTESVNDTIYPKSSQSIERPKSRPIYWMRNHILNEELEGEE